jgi:uncharacterized protein (DUF2141 family)
MRKHMRYLAFLLVGLLALSGCGGQLAVEVSLESPANGTTVLSLTPILSWNCNYADASFRLQVSSESSFQDLILDESGLGSPSYTLPEGKLSEGQTYYWRVDATKGSQISGWTSALVFQTPGSSPPQPQTGTVMVKANLDGAPWTGSVDYTVSGPQNYSGSSVDQSFSNIPVGDYTVGYSSGGPSGATLSDITPNSTQTLANGGSVTFTLNFTTQAVTAIKVVATVDGSSWTGSVNYGITGAQSYTGSSVSETFNNVPVGTYTLSYNSGGPAGASLTSITPQPTQTVTAGHTTTFTLNFTSENTSAIKVQTTLDGSRWNGQVNYTLSGPYTDSHNSTPNTFTNLPVGTYTLVYNYGGPPGATLTSITPQPTQTTAADSTTTFTLNFASRATSSIRVTATLDGQAWSGSVRYYIDGPYSDTETRVPQTLGNLPAGSYTITYQSGGPAGATLSRIQPSPTMSVGDGQQVTFNLVFHSNATGAITVNALLDGKTWETAVGSGTINYGINGPTSDSSTTMPDTFYNLPQGSYTLTYRSGGPIGASLMSISPSPTQTLPAGGTLNFTLNFHSQANGTVFVNATCNGGDWEGSVSYTLAGPYVDSSGNVPDSFNNCPAGSYTLSYNSGGPDGCSLYNITSSPTQQLSPGGTITFTLNFVGVLDDNGGLVVK